MPFTPEQWSAIYTVAEGKAPTLPIPTSVGVVGRSIATVCKRVALLWGRYEPTLRPHLTALAIAALDALVAALLDIALVNPPGPE